MHDDKQRIAVILDFRPLMAVPRILYRQFMQRKLLFHHIELFRGRICQSYPDEAVGPGQIITDFPNRQVCQT